MSKGIMAGAIATLLGLLLMTALGFVFFNRLPDTLNIGAGTWNVESPDKQESVVTRPAQTVNDVVTLNNFSSVMMYYRPGMNATLTVDLAIPVGTTANVTVEWFKDDKRDFIYTDTYASSGQYSFWRGPVTQGNWNAQITCMWLYNGEPKYVSRSTSFKVI